MKQYQYEFPVREVSNLFPSSMLLKQIKMSKPVTSITQKLQQQKQDVLSK